MHAGGTLANLHRDTVPALGMASSLINQGRSRVGMLAISHCERAL